MGGTSATKMTIRLSRFCNTKMRLHLSRYHVQEVHEVLEVHRYTRYWRYIGTLGTRGT